MRSGEDVICVLESPVQARRRQKSGLVTIFGPLLPSKNIRLNQVLSSESTRLIVEGVA